MWHRYLASSALIVASGLAISPTVLAQSVNVPFNGTVPVGATFSSPSGSGSGSGGATPAEIGSGGNVNAFAAITPALLTVQTNNPATITVSPPVLQSGPTPDPAGTTYIGFLSFGSTNLRSDVGGGSGTLPAGQTDLAVSLRVERPQPFPAGTYTYGVTLTVTP